MTLFVAGVSHKTAPVEVREQLAVQRNELVDLAQYLKWFAHLDEIVLLSTCNRVEIYGTTRQSIDRIKSALQLLSSEQIELDPHIYVHQDAEAARHLFRVTAGLDSMTLGETEITGQIKNAYETARGAGLTGPVFNRLFQKAFQTTKEIRTRTAIGRGTVSIKSAAVELIEKAFSDDLANKSVMVIGAGEMAERCVQLLVKKGVGSIFVSSRSFDRAIDLANRCGGEAVCFGYCLFEMRDVDVVIAATSSSETLLSGDDVDNLMKARHNRPLLLIDLAVPRNIDPAACALEHVALYNIDDLEGLARRGVQGRERELAACHHIIEEHVAALIEKLNAEDERLWAEERNNRWVPDPLATPSNLLPTAA
ncbi:MAG: glutamyl-tRNA reductase [Blastocatellia bacterium]|nr:glutamyl-tRNA reductase [Blastocatellia bacterium]